jgi:hypothetical protein
MAYDPAEFGVLDEETFSSSVLEGQLPLFGLVKKPLLTSRERESLVAAVHCRSFFMFGGPSLSVGCPQRQVVEGTSKNSLLGRLFVALCPNPISPHCGHELNIFL